MSIEFTYDTTRGIELLNTIINHIKPLNFKDILQSEYGDNLARYTKSNGVIDIPTRYYAVVIIDKLHSVANSCNIEIYKHDDTVYIHDSNLRFLRRDKDNLLKRFLAECAIKSGYIKSECKTSSFQKLLSKTFWLNTNLKENIQLSYKEK